MNAASTRPHCRHNGRRAARCFVGLVAPVVAPFLGLLLGALICPASVLAVPLVAGGSVSQEFYAPGPPGVSSVSPKKATFAQQYSSGDISLISNAEASAGYLSLHASANIIDMENWASGHVFSSAHGGISESVVPDWEDFRWDGETFVMEYQVRATGNLDARSFGYGAAGALASLEYRYHIGDSSGGGNKALDTDGHFSTSGTWGVMTSSFTVTRDSTFDMTLSAAADARGGKTYSPGGRANIVANADFSHTMTWLGITGIRAFDDMGNEVPLPPDVVLPLIGHDTGFDYWHSAAPVPEPNTVWLFAVGLLALARTLRRGTTKPPSAST